MSGKKHVFKMVPGQQFSCKPSYYETYSNIQNPESMKKVKLIPISEEDDTLELSIKFCTEFLDRLGMYCVEEKQNRYVLSDKPGYSENTSSFAYDNDRLVELSISWGLRDNTGYHDLIGKILRYKYVTWEESGLDDDKYYFSDEEGNIIDSPHNKVLQYSMPHHNAAKVIEDMTSLKIPKSVLISNEFTETFLSNLTGNQLKTLANTLSNEQLQKITPELNSNQLQVLAEHLTDNQLQALVNHLTNHQLQTLAQELNPEKLQIIVPILNDAQLEALVRDLNPEQVKEILPHLKVGQFKALINNIDDHQLVELAKDLDEHHLTILSKELWHERLSTLVHNLEADTLHNLVNKLDHEKLEAIAQDLTDYNRIQIIIKSLVDNPEKLQAFANSMSHEQFKELLDNLGAEELKDIIHKLPHEKVISVIGDLGSKDQSKAIIDALKEKFNEQNEKMKDLMSKVDRMLPEESEANWNDAHPSTYVLQDVNAEFAVTDHLL